MEAAAVQAVEAFRRHLTEPRPQDVTVALRLAGLPLRGPWPGTEYVIVHGEAVEPDPEPGWLVIEGRRVYSSDWL